MKSLGNDAVRLLQEHEDAEHDGRFCLAESVNCLAYIAHRIGVGALTEKQQAAVWGLVAARTRDYQAVHEEHKPQ